MYILYTHNIIIPMTMMILPCMTVTTRNLAISFCVHVRHLVDMITIRLVDSEAKLELPTATLTLSICCMHLSFLRYLKNSQHV